MARQTAATISPVTVVSKAIRSELESAVVSARPSASMPGPKGIRVPIRPSMGEIFAAVLLRPVILS